MEKSPAFQFYPADFLADANTLVMSAEEIGAYLLLLCTCWRESGIEDDSQRMAELCRLDGQAFALAWDGHIKRCFYLDEDNKWQNKRLDKERKKQLDRRAGLSTAGKKGAERRWNGDNGLAIAKPKPGHKKNMANDASSSSSSSSTSVINIGAVAPGAKIKPEKYQYIETELPSELQTDGFKTAWTYWLKYRKDRRLSLLKQCMDDQLTFLAEQPDPIECIRQSIRNSWQGVFALKSNQAGKKSGRKPIPNDYLSILKLIEDPEARRLKAAQLCGDLGKYDLGSIGL